MTGRDGHSTSVWPALVSAVANRSDGPPIRHLELRPTGTNGHVSTWGALASGCPPER